MAEVTSVRARIQDERGLFGKLAIVWLLFFALLVVAAFDAGSIMLTRYKVNDSAQQAAFEAASTFKETGDRAETIDVALKQVETASRDAWVPKDGVVIDPATGEVTVTVMMRASTVLAGRLGFLKRYTKATATNTAEPPVL